MAEQIERRTHRYFAGVCVVVLALLASTGGVACRRGPARRGGDADARGDAGRRGVESLPQRRLPDPPPLLPSPEAVTRPATAGRGGVLRVHLEAEPAHLNPLMDVEVTALQVVSGLVYEPLLECPTPGSGGGYRPALAESWQVSTDGLKVALRLRAGVKWHDGHGFNVLDVQATLEPLLMANGSGSPILRASLQDVASIELAADHVVRLVLRRPSDLVLRALCDIPILPDHLLRGPTADPAGLGRLPVGTGPFRLAGWERGRRIRLARWAGYWAEPAALNDILFEIDGDGARALARARRGEIDVVPRVLAVHYPDEVDPVSLHGTLTLVRVETNRWAYLAVNHRRAPLGDARYRRALAALWDREAFAVDLHRGLARPIATPPIAPPGPLPASGRAQAIALFDAAGYHDADADGVRDLGGGAIRHQLLLAGGSRTAATESRAFVLEARRAGVLIDTLAVEPAALLARVRKGDFDLALMQWQGRPDEDPALYFTPGGPFAVAGYKSAEVDGLLESLRRAPGPVARLPLAASLAAVFARDQPVIALYRFDQPVLVAVRAHGVAAVGDRLDLRKAWVDP